MNFKYEPELDSSRKVMISCFIQLLEELHGKEVDGCTILVEYEAARSLKGWIPRRLGKGYVFICLNIMETFCC